VHGVVTFYHDFRSHPAGRHIVKLCQAESCQAAGSARTTEHAKKVLDIDFHQTTADRSCSLEPVYCLGNCALSPSVMVDNEVFGRVDEQRFDEIVEEIRRS
jgi:formate dehydrogenase subunit gamma